MLFDSIKLHSKSWGTERYSM